MNFPVFMSKSISVPEVSPDPIGVARAAIVEDLGKRYRAGDRSVRPLDPEDEYRWFKPQVNYFSGSGQMACPLCAHGALHYERSGYNGHVSGGCTSGCVRWRE